MIHGPIHMKFYLKYSVGCRVITDRQMRTNMEYPLLLA